MSLRGLRVISCPAVPTDLTAIADPLFVLLTWAAGLALVASFGALARVVGPGFTWVTVGSAALIGLAGTLANGSTWARAGMVALLLGALFARSHALSGALLGVAGVAYAVEAALFAGWIPALTATLALGGVTGEMLLGHWYLVDPRLPRWSLRVLAGAGIAGLVLDALMLWSTDALPGGGGTVAFWLLAATSVILMVAVIGALRYPAYSGVMAATGLSYLAVLTSLGAVFLGRALVAGLGPFAS